ncbi:MAG TPA: hypothetical protein VHO90_10760 [Bacteroidales bacterium]|nr:hypothetical protein [Bacteroidales bacterium]
MENSPARSTKEVFRNQKVLPNVPTNIRFTLVYREFDLGYMAQA